MDTAKLKSLWSPIVDIADLKHPDRSWLQHLPQTVCPLNHLALLRVSGADAEDFLDKLVSCKLELQKEQPQLCSFCNPKGRILSCFTLFYKDGDIYLQMPHELVDTIIQRLKMYVLMAKVELHDASADLLGIGYIGSAPPQSADGDVLLQAPGHLPRYFVYTEASRAQTLWQQALDAGYSPLAHTAWHYTDIACAIPNIYLSTVEKLTPQMVNLDLLGAVSFSKGCYPGQEVVARTHYLGKLKRRCYLFSAETDTIKVGDPVYHSDHDEACGLVVDNHAVDTNYTLGLISIRIDALNAPELYIKTQDTSVPLKIEKMPYAVKETSHDPEKE